MSVEIGLFLFALFRLGQTPTAQLAQKEKHLTPEAPHVNPPLYSLLSETAVPLFASSVFREASENSSEQHTENHRGHPRGQVAIPIQNGFISPHHPASICSLPALFAVPPIR